MYLVIIYKKVIFILTCLATEHAKFWKKLYHYKLKKKQCHTESQVFLLLILKVAVDTEA